MSPRRSAVPVQLIPPMRWVMCLGSGSLVDAPVFPTATATAHSSAFRTCVRHGRSHDDLTRHQRSRACRNQPGRVRGMSGSRIVVLAGGVGAARFLQGVLSLVAHTDVTVIGNVGDDVVFGGLHVSPDLDTVLYTLTGAIDEERGWGARDDTSRAL